MNSSMEILKNRKEAIRLDQVKGLIHPIRTCPSDVLQYIFEWTVEVSESNRFVTAIILSQVCRHWRNIALNSPRLWSYLKVSLRRDPEEVKAFWDRTPKAVPMSIFIVDITDDDTQWRVMEECRLDRFCHIATLDFVIIQRNAVARFASPQFHSPTGRLDRLSVRDASYGRIGPLDLSPLMGQLYPTMSLELISLRSLTLGRDFVAPSITKLTLEDTKDVSLKLLVKIFPNAENVHLKEVLFVSDAVSIVNWPKLRSLTACSCSDIPWMSLQAPVITRFSWFNNYGTDVTPFVTSHKSILHLDAEYDEESDTGIILAAAPQLLTLCIDSCGAICDGSLQTIENLTSLTIYQAQRLDLNQFERMVRSRFIPKSEQHENKSYPSLTMLVDPDVKFDDIAWKTSELLSSATQSVSTANCWGVNWCSYHLNWNLNPP